MCFGPCGTIFGRRTVLQAGKLQVLVPMRSLNFFQFTWSFQPHHGPGVDSASSRNEYLKLCLGSELRPTCKADNRAAICEPVVWTLWELERLTTLQPSMACSRDSFTSPHLTSPCLTSPGLTSPHLTSPPLVSPCLTSLHLTSSHLPWCHLAPPHLTSPHLTSSLMLYLHFLMC
jgi:hypothetical protein